MLVKLTAALAVDTGVEFVARLVAAVEAGTVLLVKSGAELADVVIALAGVEVALAALVATAEAGILVDSADAAPILVVAVVAALAVVVSTDVVAAFAVIG